MSAFNEANDTLAKLRQATAQAEAVNQQPQFGYHSQLSKNQFAVKWVQVDLGQMVDLQQVVVRPCYDDFNQIGAGFGFPIRFKIEACNDRTFQQDVQTLYDGTKQEFANPKLAAVTIIQQDSAKSAAIKPAKQSGDQIVLESITKWRPARYVRVTATKLSPRQYDFNFALAELEVLDQSATNKAAGKTVQALDSIEAPVRWSSANLTDGLFPQHASPTISESERAAQIASIEKQIDDARQKVLSSEERRQWSLAHTEWPRSKRSCRCCRSRIGLPTSAWFIRVPAHLSEPVRGAASLVRFTCCGVVMSSLRASWSAGGIRSILPASADFNLSGDHAESERRVKLVQWIIDPEQPLTWRVMANRIWLYHFGRGIVDTPNDFGKMGQLPSHPALLDYLADQLRQHQSLKQLHRQIVLSATYRQASTNNPAYAQIDRDKRLSLRQQRRKLSAENVRDAVLKVAGKLDPTLFGPSFQDFVIDKPEHSPHYQYHLHDVNDPRSHRRSIYRFLVRSKQQPFFAALDCADPSLAVEKRKCERFASASSFHVEQPAGAGDVERTGPLGPEQLQVTGRAGFIRVSARHSTQTIRRRTNASGRARA